MLNNKAHTFKELEGKSMNIFNIMGSASWDNLEAKRTEEIRKGKLRFTEEFGESQENGTKTLSEKNNLIANLLRVYYENEIILCEISESEKKQEIKTQQETLEKILKLLYGFSSTENISHSNFISLLNNNVKAQKYLMLFAKECPDALKNKIVIYTLQKRHDELPDGHEKKVILSEILENKTINDDQWNRLNNKRTKAMLKFFEIQNVGTLPKFINEEENFSISSSATPPENKGENVGDYLKRMAGLAATKYYSVLRSVGFSLWKSNTSKTESNDYLTEYFKTIQTKNVQRSSYDYKRVDKKPEWKEIQPNVIYLFSESNTTYYAIKGVGAVLVEALQKDSQNISAEVEMMEVSNFNKMDDDKILAQQALGHALKTGMFPTISDKSEDREKSKAIIKGFENGMHKRLLTPILSIIKNDPTYCKHKNNHDYEVSKEAIAVARAQARI